MQFFNKSHIWADSTIKSFISVLERPKYGFKIYVVPSSHHRVLSFLIEQNDITFELNFSIDLHGTRPYLEVNCIQRLKTLKYDTDRLKGLNLSFMKGNQLKSRKLAVILGNKIFDHVNQIKTKRVING
jgi:hypothetical protein